VGRPDVKSPLGRSRRRWQGNIKVDLQVVGWGGMEWIDLAQDRDRWGGVELVNTAVNLGFHKMRGCLE